jgi:hypothetical protein
LELAFQNALEGCGTEEVTAAKLHARIMEGEEAQKKFISLKKLHAIHVTRCYRLAYVEQHLLRTASQRAFKVPYGKGWIDLLLAYYK